MSKSTPNPDENQVNELREKVHDLESESEHARQEVDQIAEIHQSLLPTAMPKVQGMSIAASHVAPNRAGGDYFDFIPLRRDSNLAPLPDSPWLIMVADASGHGPAAAMIMAMLQAVLHAHSVESEDPGVILEFINKQMAQKEIEGSFTTAILAVLDPRARTFTYACAGHHPPLLRSAQGRVSELDCEGGGPPLAVDVQARIGSVTRALDPEDTILLYTDGAIEQVGADETQFGSHRLTQSFEQARGTPREMLRRINRVLRDHRGGHEQDDDKTLVALQRLASTG